MTIDQRRALWLSRHVLPHEPALRRWLYRTSSNRTEVDDLVQETYGVLAALDSVDHIRDVRAYLFTTARSLLLQQVRRARIVEIESLAEIEQLRIPDGDTGPEQFLANHQLLQQLATALAALPEKCRQAFVFRKIHGLSQKEIAQRMGVSENTVEKHIGLGLRRLMQAMGAAATDVSQPEAETPPPARQRRPT
jgi:RNA polymerase sigma-70 factor (ECF subfamily)